MKKILGLDLGTNSIGWALVSTDEKGKPCKIEGMGSRIIPMGQELSKFEQGQAQTKNANRRIARGTRKLNKRYKQRRNKLIYILQQLGMLPEQIKMSEPFSDPLKIDKVCILPIEKKQKQYSALDLLELRVKAISQPISLQELGKIIYLFNQLRGYSGGGNEPDKEENNDETVENEEKKGNDSYVAFGKILSISEPEIIIYKGKELKKHKVSFETEDGVLEGETFISILKTNESLGLLVNVRTTKKGDETVTFKLPNKTNWRKKMENLEKELSEFTNEKGEKGVLSEYFLSILKENRWAKIRNNVILRSRYQAEFDKIWNTQSKNSESELYKVLQNLAQEKLSEILHFIFPGTKETQEKYRQIGLEKGLFYVIRNQIIYYQRELKDQSNLISNCLFEKSEKAIAKSHPVFQEYKIWEQINKLTINTKIENGTNRKGEIKYKYVDKSIPMALKEWLFDELQMKKEIGFGPIFNKLKKEYNFREGTEFLNGMNPKAKLRGNETKFLLKKALGENLWQQLDLDKKDRQIELWDILYNVKGNEYEIDSERTSQVLFFLKKYSNDIQNIEQIAIQISKIKFSRSYAALSQKAIENILPLVKCGKYFDSELSASLNEKIIYLLNENVSDPFEKAAQEYLENNIDVLVYGGIMNAYATILVYGKHTAKEYAENERIDNYKQIIRLKQGELRNPLVEQLISETLMVVKDIWKEFKEKPSEIRIELARELKNNAERREKMYKQNSANQKANDEVKNLLIELKQETSLANIEKYKIWASQENLEEKYIKKYKDPSKSEIEKMKLWKEQGHISPYTKQPIPLSKLFNKGEYDIDHIIPQSRYFDDSFTNKVIAETAVNREKSNRTAMEYFETGSSISSVISKEEFIDHVNKVFHGTKRKNLLATKVPEDPVARQMKETQYISVRVKEELNKIVGNNVKTTTGGVTDYLRNHWGLTDKFKQILKSRYENVQPLLAESEYEKYAKAIEAKQKEYKEKKIEFTDVVLSREKFIEWFNQNFMQKKNNKLVIKGWSKRIDHRHHAIDALTIACTEPAHVKRLNDLNKELQMWLDNHKKEILPEFEGTPSELLDEILNLEEEKRKAIFTQIEKFKSIDLPWIGFPEDAEKAIQPIVVSQKPKDKLLIQYEEKKDNSRNIIKTGKLQIKIRGQLHEGTLYGKSQGVETYRIPLSKLAVKKFATEKTIDKIANEYLKTVIKQHLKDLDDKKEEAFSAEGILALNKKLGEKKNKKGQTASHPPISSIKVFYRDPAKIKKRKGQEEADEALERLFRKKAYNETLLVKTGDNYLFAIMEDKNGDRVFDLITFFEATQKLKEMFNKSSDKRIFSKDQFFKNHFEEKNKAKLLFTLKQGDLVYMPANNEEVITDSQSPLYNDFWSDKTARSENIYYVTKYSGNQIYFIKHSVANPIIDKKEFGSQNAYEKVNGLSIKKHCIKLNIDRLGNIKPLP